MSDDDREALARYRYAVNWIGADSWDFCSECRERIRWAAALDNDRHITMPPAEMSTLGRQFDAFSYNQWVGHLLIDGAGI